MTNEKIIAALKRTDLTDIKNLENLWQMARNTNDLVLNEEVYIRSARELAKGRVEFNELYRKTLLFAAPNNFDKYMIYLEIDRNPKDRFYMPRRKILKQLVDALQDLSDDNLDELFLSMPPRVGKTTILTFYITWVIGKEPEKSNLYSAYSDVITSAMHRGVLEIITDPVTYKWGEVFPDRKIADKNANDETINIDRKKKYPSITCRSLYGTLNGACDCNGTLVSDDLIGGIEEALNKDRMISTWSKVDNNLIPRKKEKAKMLWCGTRWSMIDPAGLRMEVIQNEPKYKSIRYKIINIPALDPITEESNFDYQYQVGFSTEYYQQRRASFERNNDMASWMAQYMGEPIERQGALFTPEEMKFFNGELSGTPDRIFMAVDPAYGGGDFVAAPICYQYGTDIYVKDVIYSNAEKNITQPLIANAIMEHGVQASRFEANKSTEGYKDGVELELKSKGYRHNITTKAASPNTSKEIRIYDRAPEIREMYFLEDGKRSKEYSLFMQNVYAFKVLGKNKHDDAPDSLAMAAEMAFSKPRTAQIFARPF